MKSKHSCDQNRQQQDIKLYYYPGTRSVKTRWMLEELAVNYQLHIVDLAQGDHRKDEYLSIHPLGKVPAMKIGDKVIFESLAICLYLADYYRQPALAPEFNSFERGEYYQWMALSTGTLEPSIIEASRVLKAKDAGVDLIDMGPALTPFDHVASYIDNTLATCEYLVGDSFTVADLMVGSVLFWADNLGLLTDYKHAKDWVERLQQRPAYRQAIRV